MVKPSGREEATSGEMREAGKRGMAAIDGLGLMGEVVYGAELRRVTVRRGNGLLALFGGLVESREMRGVGRDGGGSAGGGFNIECYCAPMCPHRKKLEVIHGRAVSDGDKDEGK